MPQSPNDVPAYDEGKAHAPTGLTCELLTRPETTVITNNRPVFGWVVSDGRRGAAQTAYQIAVATSRSAACEDADLWDSGKVESPQSINVPYTGRPLPPGSTCWWAVRTWDSQDQPSPWSEPRQINPWKASQGDAFYSDQWIDVTTQGLTGSVRREPPSA